MAFPSEWGQDGGILGRWIRDENGLPAFEYTYLDKFGPGYSDFEDHWHQVGNDRFTAEAHAGGWVSVYRWERGMTRLSNDKPCAAEKSAGVGSLFGGGSNPLLQLLRTQLSADCSWKVYWGMGYAEWLCESDGLIIRKRVSAPFGDDPVILIDVEINLEERFIEKHGPFFVYKENWAIEPYAVTLPAPMTKFGNPPKGKSFSEKAAWYGTTAVSGALRKAAEWWRSSYKYFLDFEIVDDDKAKTVVARPCLKHLLPVPTEHERSWRDLYPEPIFMAVGDFREDVVQNVGAESYKGGVRFIGEAKFERKNELKVSFIFGWGKSGEIPGYVGKYRKEKAESWSGKTPSVEIREEPWLEREMSWHAYYLRSMSVKDYYFECHFLPQGSAYSYLHGMHGAPRDYMLSAVPMIYLSPRLAREMLMQTMMLMKPSGEILYAHGGFGMSSDAGGLHSAPTDLPIFFLWGLVEYLGATGDESLLDEEIPFYPKEAKKSSSVKERIELAWYYLRHKVGRGPHGLLRVGSGDWNDPISLMVSSRRAFTKNGESCFNTAFAVHVLPKSALLVEKWNPKLAEEMRRYAVALRKAMEDTWTGKWFLRGYDGRGGTIGEDTLFLDSNVWCIIAGIGGEEKVRILIDNVWHLLDEPSPIGATILDKGVKVKMGYLADGWDCNGGVWCALNGLLAWGYSIYDADKAWRSLFKQSLTAHARAYPHIWYGIWSGPDAYNAHWAQQPGETFIHAVTPMQEYPIMNSNAHALPLLALIKLLGIEPNGTKLEIVPRLPSYLESWKVTFPLLSVSKCGNKIEVEFSYKSCQHL